MSSNGLHQGATLPVAATLGIQYSRPLTKDWPFKMQVAAPTPWADLAAALPGWLNLFWLPDWDWLLLCGYQCTYFHNGYVFLVQPIWVAYTYASLPSCLHRCVLQSLCLHSWNIRLCQESICSTKVKAILVMSSYCYSVAFRNGFEGVC